MEIAEQVTYLKEHEQVGERIREGGYQRAQRYNWQLMAEDLI